MNTCVPCFCESIPQSWHTRFPYLFKWRPRFLHLPPYILVIFIRRVRGAWLTIFINHQKDNHACSQIFSMIFQKIFRGFFKNYFDDFVNYYCPFLHDIRNYCQKCLEIIFDTEFVIDNLNQQEHKSLKTN